MQIQPYLFFDGRAEEAAEFYRAKLGAEVVMLMRNRDAPDKPPPGMLPPNSENKVMHMALEDRRHDGAGFRRQLQGQAELSGLFAVAHREGRGRGRPDVLGARRWRAGADAVGKTFFSPAFGMLADRFGVGWMVYVTP